MHRWRLRCGPRFRRCDPGGKYLLDVVIRTLTLGHPFTQGTTDSNEVWLDVTVTSGGKTIGRSGALDDRRQVDPWSHFVNVFMLDRDGNRIERRNPQDIFVPLYDNQIPPGAAQTVHYALDLPADLPGPVTVSVKLQYRKFDAKFMNFVAAFGQTRRFADPRRRLGQTLPQRSADHHGGGRRDHAARRGPRPAGRQPVAGDSRVAALERLRHRLTAQGEGRAASGGRGIFPGRKAGTLRRAVEPRDASTIPKDVWTRPWKPCAERPGTRIRRLRPGRWPGSAG